MRKLIAGILGFFVIASCTLKSPASLAFDSSLLVQVFSAQENVFCVSVFCMLPLEVMSRFSDFETGGTCKKSAERKTQKTGTGKPYADDSIIPEKPATHICGIFPVNISTGVSRIVSAFGRTASGIYHPPGSFIPWVLLLIACVLLPRSGLIEGPCIFCFARKNRRSNQLRFFYLAFL